MGIKRSNGDKTVKARNFEISLPLNECKEKHFAFALIATRPQLASPICSMNLGGVAYRG